MENSLLYLSRRDVEAVGLPVTRVIELLELAFAEKGAGRVEMPPKPGIHTQPDAFIHAMPAFIPAMESAGIKWVSGYPANPESDLPYISGLLILNDFRTGIPYAVMDCTWITAYRTAGATALAAKYLARPESSSAAIIACGVQGRTHLEALASMFPLEVVYAYDIDHTVQERFVTEMAVNLNLEIIGVEHPRVAVSKSEMIVTSGPILKEPTPTIEKDWLPRGAFASAVDFDSYWQPEALTQIDLLSTDDMSQFDYYRGIGYFQSTPQPYADLGEIVAGVKPGRTSPGERTMAMNLGLALDDMAVAPEVYKLAVEMGIGTWLPL